MIATLNKSKTALSINKQEFKAALSKIGDGIDKQIASLKKPSKAMMLRKWHARSLTKQISLKP
jgi:hypothetical protein